MYDYSEVINLCETMGVPFCRDELLSRHTTFRIGGPAGFFCRCMGAQSWHIVMAAKEAGIPLFVLGKGSNVLFADEGYDGIVMQLCDIEESIVLINETTIQCESGVKLASLCEFAREHSLSGLEFAFGIPGSVGGAIYMNAGAYGGEIKDVLTVAHHYGISSGEPGIFREEELELSYRHSAYSSDEYVITGGFFRLQKDDKEAIAARMTDYMNRRREKQPLEYPSAGSAFKRPAKGYASALVDQCGLKGFAVGGAAVSEKHAGFVINTGGATAADVLELLQRVKERVLEETGVELEPEVKLVGGHRG